MRTEEEIIKRLAVYETNLHLAKKRHIESSEIIKQAIIELSWVLGEEPNIKFDRTRKW